MTFLLEAEPVVRLGSFVVVFTGVAVWERLASRRPLRIPRGRRWLWNWLLVVLNTAILRVLFPTAAVGVALWAEAEGVGLFHMLDVPVWVAMVGSVVLLDLAIYVQHVIFHAMPTLWRLHQMHHADLDLDVTSGTRFHPIEMVLSMGIKLGVVAFLGAPAAAVVVFEVVLNAMAMFNHGNIALPLWLDRVLRWFVVTPDVHRIHHSVIPRETHSNYGFNLSVWDRLFGTFRDQPEEGHLGVVLGTPETVDEENQTLPWLLALPFRSGG